MRLNKTITLLFLSCLVLLNACYDGEAYRPEVATPDKKVSSVLEIKKSEKGMSYQFSAQTYGDIQKANIVIEYNGQYLINRWCGDNQGNLHIGFVANQDSLPIKAYVNYWGSDSLVTFPMQCMTGFHFPDDFVYSLLLDQWRHINITDSFKCDYRAFLMYPEKYINEDLLKPYNISKQVLIDQCKKDIRNRIRTMDKLKEIAEARSFKFIQPLKEKTSNVNANIYPNIFNEETEIYLNFESDSSVNERLFEVYKLGKNRFKEKLIKTGGNSIYGPNALNDLKEGFYKVKAFTNNDSLEIPLIINSKKPAKTIILAPITTWQAYSTFGGKSFYKSNSLENVTQLAMDRPLLDVFLQPEIKKPDFHTLFNTYNWFKKQGNVKVYPDYYLEQDPAAFKDAETIVLAQHCEYFSPRMYQNLKEIIKDKNFVSMGGNQIYWKVLFTEDFGSVLCQKDEAFFPNSYIPGGKWRDRLTSEAALLGNAFTDKGMHTYAGFEVMNGDHPLWKGVENGTIFGEATEDYLAGSGDETDKLFNGSSENTVVLAKGLNEDNGGAEIVYIDRGDVGTLSFGSITAGEMLNRDKIVEQLLKNFFKRHK